MPFVAVLLAGLNLLPWPCRFAVWLACLIITGPLDFCAMLRRWGLLPFLCGGGLALAFVCSLMPPPLVPRTSSGTIELSSVHGWSYFLTAQCIGSPLLEVSKDVMRATGAILRGMSAVLIFFADFCDMWASWN